MGGTWKVANWRIVSIGDEIEAAQAAVVVSVASPVTETPGEEGLKV